MDVLLGALVSLGIGGLVGLEREWRRKLSGIRTFMIISLLGFLSFRVSSFSPLIIPVSLVDVFDAAEKTNKDEVSQIV